MSAVRLARGVHAPRPRDQVRRLLPRPRRPVPRRAPARASRRSASPRRPACRRGVTADTIVVRVQRRRRRRGRGRAVRRRAGGDPRRAGRREHGLRPAGAGLPRGAAAALRRVGRAARLRRGDHRLPRRARRRAGALRRHARPDDPRQDRRRRPAARGVRRRRRGDGAASRRSGDVYQAGTLSAAIRSRPRPGSRCCGGCATRRSTTSSSGARRGSTTGLAPFGRVQRVGAMLTLFAGRDEPVERFAELDTDRYGELFRGLLERGDLRRPEPVRVPVPVARARRRARSTRRSRRWAMSSRSLRRSPTARAPRARSGRRRCRAEPSWQPVFSPLAPHALALGLETIYEAYLVHYGTPRLFEPPDADERVLLGDYLYAHGLVRIAEAGGVDAVAAMAELISRCAALRADGRRRRRRRRGSTPRARSAATRTTTRWRDALARHSARVAAVIFDAATEGKHVILGMLVTGLIFLVVIGLGELTHWAGHRRARARTRSPPGVLAAVDSRLDGDRPRPARVDRAPRARGRARPRRRRGRPAPRGDGDRRPHRQGRRARRCSSSTRRAAQHPLLDQPVRHRAAHVPRVRRRAARRRRRRSSARCSRCSRRRGSSRRCAA